MQEKLVKTRVFLTLNVSFGLSFKSLISTLVKTTRHSFKKKHLKCQKVPFFKGWGFYYRVRWFTSNSAVWFKYVNHFWCVTKFLFIFRDSHTKTLRHYVTIAFCLRLSGECMTQFEAYLTFKPLNFVNVVTFQKKIYITVLHCLSTVGVVEISTNSQNT